MVEFDFKEIKVPRKKFWNPKTNRFNVEPMEEYGKRVRAAIIRELGAKCSICGKNQNLEIHHNNPKDKYNKNTNSYNRPIHDLDLYNRNPLAIVLICTFCHKGLHSDEEREDYIPIPRTKFRRGQLFKEFEKILEKYEIEDEKISQLWLELTSNGVIKSSIQPKEV